MGEGGTRDNACHSYWQFDLIIPTKGGHGAMCRGGGLSAQAGGRFSQKDENKTQPLLISYYSNIASPFACVGRTPQRMCRGISSSRGAQVKHDDETNSESAYNASAFWNAIDLRYYYCSTYILEQSLSPTVQ